jgi:hypothetical protein
MDQHGWYERMLAWVLGSPDTISVHLVLLIMLTAALLLRRSLGAWPVWWAAFFGALSIDAWWVLNGVPHAPWPISLVNMLAMPTLIFQLARSQSLPGLRRGQMSEAQRKRWVATHAFADEPREQRALVRLTRHDTF